MTHRILLLDFIIEIYNSIFIVTHNMLQKNTEHILYILAFLTAIRASKRGENVLSDAPSPAAE